MKQPLGDGHMLVEEIGVHLDQQPARFITDPGASVGEAWRRVRLSPSIQDAHSAQLQDRGYLGGSVEEPDASQWLRNSLAVLEQETDQIIIFVALGHCFI